MSALLSTPSPSHQSAPLGFGYGTAISFKLQSKMNILERHPNVLPRLPIHFHTFLDYCSEIGILWKQKAGLPFRAERTSI
ncbi:hypothetical protein CEXT_570631 [Caerostris extrusa]|uniref:Uncharacterized protein n=1 Tax=Caerostris extrusa TaxID=172846 RepID=A0AAV4Y4F7_CAEEX|nr:hypothetical protein CEXT_570631 [Caerostris extrusa]